MNNEIYESIIRNSKIAYLKINCKKNSHNKYIDIEVLEQNKEFENVFKILTENNVFNKEATELIINNWIKKNLNQDKFDTLIRYAIKNGYVKNEYNTKLSDKNVVTEMYYLKDYFIIIFSMNYNTSCEDTNFKIYNWSKDLNGIYIDAYDDYHDDSTVHVKKSIIGKKDLDLWSKSDIDEFRKQENSVILDKDVKTFYRKLTKNDGTNLYLESTIWPLLDDKNKVIGTRGFSIKINDDLILEKSLEQNESNFREITKYCDSVFIIRNKDRATYVSPAFRNVFEAEPNDLYKDFDKIYEYFDRVEFNDCKMDYEFDGCNEGKYKIKLDNGKEKWIWYKSLPIKDSSGNILKRAGILTDITERINIDEEKNQLKLDFFANLSHELRTPINLISTTIQLIKLNLKKLSSKEADKFYKYTYIMEMNSLRLVRLINNLLDSTRIDAGFINFNPINADIVGFVEDICDSVVDFTKSNNMNLIFDPNIEEEFVLFDPDIIERTMLNLLSNAIKFNKQNGNIYVNLYSKDDEIIVSVKDEGVGIPQEKVNLIFERFEQVQSRNKIEKQGSGIGLYLVNSLVVLHGGKIKVNSKVNEGTEFIVTIPKKLGETTEEFMLTNEEVRYNRINIEFSDI